MGNISEYGCAYVVAYITVLATIICIMYFKYIFQYWKSRDVPYIKPRIPLGNMENPFSSKTKAFSVSIQETYSEFKSKGHKHGGFYVYAMPLYLPVDLQYIKNILTSDFFNFERDGLANLFCIDLTEWKSLQAELTPIFTSGNMKMIFETLADYSPKLRESVDECSASHEAVDIKEILADFTADVIGSCALGIESNSPNDDLKKFTKRILETSKFEYIKDLVYFAFPNFSRWLGLREAKKDVADLFIDIIKDTVEYRERTTYSRKDFLQILVDLRGGDMRNLSLTEMAAECYLFFIASFETSLTTTTFCLFELATNPEIQDKLRDVVYGILEKHNGELTYEALKEMKYMDRVINETLRKYPPLPVLNGVSAKTYHDPDADVILEKGCRVIISTLGLQRDSDYYPDPEIFDPERFSRDNQAKQRMFTYLPFGEGLEHRIGLRFGLMQTKIGLTTLLRNYKFSLNAKTKIPLVMDPSSLLLTTRGGIWLDMKKLEKTV